MKEEYHAIGKAIVGWLDANQRQNLPWRQDYLSVDRVKKTNGPNTTLRNPYYVWVAEIMAQQTQINTIIPYFNKWISLFPTVPSVAEASEESVRAAWSGLGYYRRALYLKRGAEYVMEKLNGKLPTKAVELKKIPGIGPYTAAAISSICFGEKIISVDGNVIRVISRLRCERGVNPKSAKSIKDVREWGQLMMNEGCCENPGAFNEGLMEIGARICKPSGPPLCEECPLQKFCKSYTAKLNREIDTIEGVIPERADAPKKKHEIVLSVIHEFRNDLGNEDGMVRRFVVVQRPEDGLLGGMLEFPSTSCGSSYENVRVNKKRITELRKRLDAGNEFVQHMGSVRHLFSHIDMEVLVYHALWEISMPTPGKKGINEGGEEINYPTKEEYVCNYLAKGLGVDFSRIFVKTEEEIRKSSSSRLLLKILEKVISTEEAENNEKESTSNRKRKR